MLDLPTGTLALQLVDTADALGRDKVMSPREAIDPNYADFNEAPGTTMKASAEVPAKGAVHD